KAHIHFGLIQIEIPEFGYPFRFQTAKHKLNIWRKYDNIRLDWNIWKGWPQALISGIGLPYRIFFGVRVTIRLKKLICVQL
ncbi:MAG: hypothetical protein K2P98_05000, partial [Neisseriaceae bacterium]|nr:hypothetical protein [Neisseriaceae bacterium]